MSDPTEWRDETQADATSVPEEGTDPGAATPGDRVTVVALDFSPPSKLALAWALDQIGSLGGALHLVHVVERRWRASDLGADPGAIARELTDVERLAAEELRAHAEEARGRHETVHEHVAIGRPADEIVRVAGELGAQTIIVGSHGHDAIARLLVGSVAERVARTAPCTVVIVKGA
jgi:nucleotide-binding universal stress UspA family protein